MFTSDVQHYDEAEFKEKNKKILKLRKQKPPKILPEGWDESPHPDPFRNKIREACKKYFLEKHSEMIKKKMTKPFEIFYKQT